MHDSHTAWPADDTELLTVLRGASSAFARLPTAAGAFADRCELTCILELLLKEITARVRLIVPDGRSTDLPVTIPWTLRRKGTRVDLALDRLQLRGGSEGQTHTTHSTQALATAVSGELAQLLEQVLAQHRQAAAAACAGRVDAAAAEARQHLLHLDLPAHQVRQRLWALRTLATERLSHELT